MSFCIPVDRHKVGDYGSQAVAAFTAIRGIHERALATAFYEEQCQVLANPHTVAVVVVVDERGIHNASSHTGQALR